jgi:hypothetical protein
MTGFTQKVGRVVGVPIRLVGRTANTAGKVTSAVILGSKDAVSATTNGLSNAGVGVVSGARKVVTGTSGALSELLEKSGRNVDGAVTGIFKGGRRSTRKNKNRSNKNRKNKNRSNKNRSNKNRSNKNRNRH